MKISEHVYFYQAPDSNLLRGTANGNTMVIRGRRLILVDPCSPGRNLDKIERQMGFDGLQMSNVQEVWLTHAHPDHAAAAPVLQERLGIPVRCSAEDEPIMHRPEGMIEKERRAAGAFVRQVFPYPDWMVSGFFWWFWDRWTPTEDVNAFKPDEIIDIGTEVRVTPMPGHSKGEVAFWLPEDKVLISGDLLNFGKYELPSINMPCSDLTDAMASLKKIQALDPDKLIPGHNKAVLDRESVQKIAKAAIQCCESLVKEVEQMLQENPTPGIDAMTTRLFHNLPKIHFFERPSLTFAVLKHLNALDQVSP